VWGVGLRRERQPNGVGLRRERQPNGVRVYKLNAWQLMNRLLAPSRYPGVPSAIASH